MENKELHEKFFKDFKELLKKYDSHFNMEWYDCDRCHLPTIYFNAKYNSDWAMIRPQSELLLDNYIYEN